MIDDEWWYERSNTLRTTSQQQYWQNFWYIDDMIYQALLKLRHNDNIARVADDKADDMKDQVLF